MVLKSEEKDAPWTTIRRIISIWSNIFYHPLFVPSNYSLFLKIYLHVSVEISMLFSQDYLIHVYTFQCMVFEEGWCSDFLFKLKTLHFRLSYPFFGVFFGVFLLLRQKVLRGICVYVDGENGRLTSSLLPFVPVWRAGLITDFYLSHFSAKWQGLWAWHFNLIWKLFFFFFFCNENHFPLRKVMAPVTSGSE